MTEYLARFRRDSAERWMRDLVEFEVVIPVFG
jgi:hypothetical protein